VPAVAAVSIVATFFVAGTAVVAELAVDLAVAISSVAIGWYAWRNSQSPSVRRAGATLPSCPIP
jgi:type IV secretory pathway protease TraF